MNRGSMDCDQNITVLATLNYQSNSKFGGQESKYRFSGSDFERKLKTGEHETNFCRGSFNK